MLLPGTVESKRFDTDIESSVTEQGKEGVRLFRSGAENIDWSKCFCVRKTHTRNLRN